MNWERSICNDEVFFVKFVRKKDTPRPLNFAVTEKALQIGTEQFSRFLSGIVRILQPFLSSNKTALPPESRIGKAPEKGLKLVFHLNSFPEYEKLGVEYKN